MPSPLTVEAAWQQVQEAWGEAWQWHVLPYASSSALAVSLQVLLGFMFLTWVASVLTRNFSFVDRLWSLTPPVFAWHWTLHAFLTDGQWDARLLLMSALVTLWGARLTFNFWRKGGYKLSEEDYRWAVIRRYLHWTLFELFNVVFIAGYQHVLLMLLVAPSYAVYLRRGEPLNAVDAVATILLLLCFLLETAADQQQWNFYSTKHALMAAKKPLTGDYKAGFNRSGLFRFSRHPNFFGEMSLWWAFYLFSVAAGENYLNVSCIGALLLTLLFQGSTAFTEFITASKYPLYRQYQQQVSTLIPWFPHPHKKKNN